MFRKTTSLVMIVLLFLGGVAPTRSYSQTPEYTIAVADLVANGISETEARSLSNELRTYITKLLYSPAFQKKYSEQYTVVERSQMDKIFEEFEVQNTGCTDISCAIEFGKMFSSERIVIGSVGYVGETYMMNVRIVDVESSTSLKGASYKTSGSRENLLNEGIPDVSRSLFGIGKGFPYWKTAIITAVVVIGACVYQLATRPNEGEITIDIPVPQE